MVEAQDSATVYTKLQRIAELARRTPKRNFTALAHHINIDWLWEANRRTPRNRATGIDEMTAAKYEEALWQNLGDLLERIKAGTYRAPPVRRVHIPKGDGSETRPIGIPTYEDKVAQRALAMLLEAVYEQDFLDCSYGYRPKRSAHDALAKVRAVLMEMHGGWVLELDIRKFFDSLEHARLMEVLRQRVCDGVVTRMVAKWLHAGVMEEGRLSYPEAGTPQGGVISPVLANIYLHEVLDVWFTQVVQPRMRGRSQLVRYADDAVLLFEQEEDAKRVLEVLPKRFEKYGLTLHPDKTRLIAFKRPPRNGKPGPGNPGSFDLLGFTHYWAKSHKGNWVILRKTAKSRFGRFLKAAGEWLRRNRHRNVAVQRQMLWWKLVGHYNYYGIAGNGGQVWKMRHRVVRVWWKWLGRRSQKGRLSWTRMYRLLERYPLPRPDKLVLV